MNMPFELGLTVVAAYHNPKRHTWCIFEKCFGTWYTQRKRRPTAILASPENEQLALPAPAAYACLAARSPMTGNTTFFPW
jgi:hypothetical protein